MYCAALRELDLNTVFTKIAKSKSSYYSINWLIWDLNEDIKGRIEISQ